MNLHELQREYAERRLDKADFIAKACMLHQQLYAYLPHLTTSGVSEIRLRTDGVCFVMGNENVLMEAPPNEARIAPLEALNFGAYEPLETAIMNLLAADARCILDVGANIGYHALRLALREPLATVHAFEPLPQSFDYLTRNIAANNLGPRVRAYGYGLSNANGAVEFHIAPENGTNASLLNVATRSDATSVVGLTMKLDDWAANTRSAPDYIKLDVEGAELWVLEGGAQTIAACKPRVFAELLRKWSAPFGYHPNDVLRFFRDLGYGCWAIGPEGALRMQEITDTTQETNYAFLHEQAHVGYIALLQA